MEFLLVHFEEDRGVIVNGEPQGRTNQVLELEKGRHEIRLEPPPDYDPPKQDVVLENTTVLSPMEVHFAKL